MHTTTQALEYDVVIMGAGFAGVCQARHLLLNIPNIRVAIVDPRSQEPSKKEHRLGESTVEIASIFLIKELGLHDYLIENHTPKVGLNFHWPKDITKTESIDDYFNIWVNRQLTTPTFHLNRSKFDRDLLKMNLEMGVHFYNGRVVDVDLTPKDAIKTVKVKLDGDYLELKAKHVIDAAGRKFIIGRKTDNLMFAPEDLFGINTGTAWVWVKNIDRTIFDQGWHPTEGLVSRYYCTNHWMGHGHWLWMIPLDKDSMELSVGITHHKDIIPSEHLNSKEKFYEFLKVNHNLLYQILTSGEHTNFNYWPRVAHKSKTLFSPDNWYILGDAANNFDALYSMGTSMSALGIESVTEIIRAQLAGEPDAEKKREAYNRFNLAFAHFANHLVSNQAKQLGNASIMSWRVYADPMWWFGVLVPMYIGKWHLDPNFIAGSLGIVEENLKFYTDVYEQFNQLSEQGTNIGFQDLFRADELPWKYNPFAAFDNFWEDAKLEPQKLNVFAGIQATAFYTAIWFVMLQWKGFGLSGFLKPRNLYHIARLLLLSAKTSIPDLAHRLGNIGRPANSHIANIRQEFKSYQFCSQLVDSMDGVRKKSFMAGKS